jgi:uncharacterized protein (TIGR03086 family)
MSMNSLLAAAGAGAGTVVRAIRPEHLHAATPCRDWDVRDLANHLLQVVHALDLAGRRRPVPADVWARDLLTDGWTGRFADDVRTAVDAWADPAAWEGAVDLGGPTPMPAPLIATMFAGDLAIHGWDLARATGQGYRCDDAVADATERFVVDMAEQGRQRGIFAAPAPAPPGASAFDRALALSGRDPGWRPSTGL